MATEKRIRALLCTADEAIRAAAEEAGYAFVTAATADEALPLLRDEVWDVLVLDGTPDFETLGFVNGLTGLRRRALFLVRVDARCTTGDRFSAWSESADLVVHPDDLGFLGGLVEDALVEKREFYRCFRNIQRESGARLGAHA